MKIQKRRVLFLLLIFALTGSLVAADNGQAPSVNVFVDPMNLQKPLIGEEDSPAPVMLSWIGTGKLGTYTISNTGQNGYFEPPVGWPGYTGDFPFNYFSGNGRTGEFPRGSQQYYVWAAGVWIGAMVEKQVGDTVILEPRVATGAYYSDQGALSNLYQTNQKIPAGQDGEGDFLFKQKGVPDAKDYQILWTYTDSTINARRRANGHPELQIDPAEGDYLSNEDTYTVWGDYFPEKDASTLFSFGYDVDPVGVRVEQRTYSWSADSYVYLNYRITNMNDFPLRDVYFGYFMDNDIGDAADDLIGYDENLNLGYSYDSDLQETGWKTLAGYVGTVFLKTPAGPDGSELGLTGFQTWTIDGDESDVDNQEEDDLKYAQLAKGGYEIFSEPQDVRQLTCSGPVSVLEAGETVEVTILVVAGGSLDEIRRNTLAALDRYNAGYIGPEAPPSPNLAVVPGDERAVLSWDNGPELIPDPASGEVDFEGYRVYRSTDGGLSWGTTTTDLDAYPNGFVPIAEYDIPGNSTGIYISTAYQSGSSSATIDFAGHPTSGNMAFLEGKYTIELLAGRQLHVYNLTQQKSYAYNPAARTAGSGFAIVSSANPNTAYPDPTYRSGEYVLFDSIYVQITDGIVVDEITGDTTYSAPNIGDVFGVETFKNTAIGNQAGIRYIFEDDKLTNGRTYVYSVTAFDQGSRTDGIPSLESSIQENKTFVVPRGVPVDRTVETLSNVARLAGASNGGVEMSVDNPLLMINADYRVEFFGDDSLTKQSDFLRVINTTVDTIVVDSVAIVGGNAATSFYGLNLAASGPASAVVDPDNFGWVGSERSFTFVNAGGRPQPFDYEVTFTDPLTNDPATFTGDTLILPTTGVGAWTVRNVTLDTKVKTYAFPLIPLFPFQNSSIIRLMRENYTNPNDFGFALQADMTDESNPVQAGDVWKINTLKPFLNDDVFSFTTTALGDLKNNYSLENIKVVPNPFYLRASWDVNRFEKHVNFTHLPKKCTIRIFTVSGILINTIEHNEDNGDQAGYHSWNMRNEENLDVASGLYIFQVKDEKTGEEKIGKFAVVL